MRRMHVEAFKMAKGTGPGVYRVTDPYGTKKVPKLDLLFLEVKKSDQIGNRSCVNKTTICQDFLEPFGTGPL